MCVKQIGNPEQIGNPVTDTGMLPTHFYVLKHIALFKALKMCLLQIVSYSNTRKHNEDQRLALIYFELFWFAEKNYLVMKILLNSWVGTMAASGVSRFPNNRKAN